MTSATEEYSKLKDRLKLTPEEIEILRKNGFVNFLKKKKILEIKQSLYEKKLKSCRKKKEKKQKEIAFSSEEYKSFCINLGVVPKQLQEEMLVNPALKKYVRYKDNDFVFKVTAISYRNIYRNYIWSLHRGKNEIF